MTQKLNTVHIRFAGDSGDGMQLTGTQFTDTSSLAGNDVHTFPDYPAEIRAPAGTLAGVSGFQVTLSDKEIHTVGDKLTALIAMNPAALKTNIDDLENGGILIINEDAFSEKDLKKAHYSENPLNDSGFDDYQLFSLPLTSLTINAVQQFKLTHSQSKKCKNMFALGIACWLFDRPLDHTMQWLSEKFKSDSLLADANQAALKAGYFYADTTELFSERYHVEPAKLSPGLYRQITGNEAFALACATLTKLTQKKILLSGYPITPASTILEYVARYQHFGITTFQAEDEIAAVCAAIGASYGGALGLCCTSGPGLDLKGEGLGLAVMTELPLVVIDVQRAGPSTGLPTKTEQGDLLAALHGRHGEAPIPILAPRSPSDCFDTLLEAFQIAVRHMTPVILLSDTNLANSAEPWLLPDVDQLPAFNLNNDYSDPFKRNSETLVRPWVVPGMKDLQHRIGGIEKDMATNHVSYDPQNHSDMVQLRSDKIKRIADHLPEQSILGHRDADCVVVSWGSTYGTVISAIEELATENIHVAMLHLRHLNPFPSNFSQQLKQYKKVIVAELNQGQLCGLIRSEFLIDAIPLNKTTGKPFLISDIKDALRDYAKQ